MKNILIITVIVAGAFASIGTASAIELTNLDASNWVLETLKSGIR